MISLLHCWLLCFAHSLSTCHFLFWLAQAKLSANDPKQSLWNLDRFPASLESGLVKLTSETPIGKSGGWSERDKERSPSAVVGLWEVQTLITLEVVKQMSVLRSRQSWPTKPNGPFIVQNVHPYLRKTQNQLQINLGTVFAPLPFCAPYILRQKWHFVII